MKVKKPILIAVAAVAAACVLFVAYHVILLLMWHCTGIWIWTAEYKEYASEFNTVKDYVLENYASDETRALYVTSLLSEHGRTLCDRETGKYAELPESVQAALDAIDENAFPYKHSDLDKICVRGGRVDFCIGYGVYRLVYSPDGKPTWYHDPDDDTPFRVKRIKDGWYHLVAK